MTKEQEKLYLFIRDNPGIRARYMPGDSFENANNLLALEKENRIFSILYNNKYYRWYAK